VGANEVRNAERFEETTSEVIGAKTKVVVLLQAAGSFSQESIPTRRVLLPSTRS